MKITDILQRLMMMLRGTNMTVILDAVLCRGLVIQYLQVAYLRSTDEGQRLVFTQTDIEQPAHSCPVERIASFS